MLTIPWCNETITTLHMSVVMYHNHDHCSQLAANISNVYVWFQHLPTTLTFKAPEIAKIDKLKLELPPHLAVIHPVTRTHILISSSASPSGRLCFFLFLSVHVRCSWDTELRIMVQMCDPSDLDHITFESKWMLVILRSCSYWADLQK